MRAVARRTALLSAAALAGCSTILSRPAYLQRTTWPLAPPPPASLARFARAHPRKTLVIADFTAAPGQDQLGVQWLNANGSVHVDFYNSWQVEPAAAAQSDAMNWLAASRMFAAVVGPGTTLRADLLLDGQLTSFIAEPRTLRGHCALAVTLLDPRASPPKVLLQTTLSAEAPMRQPTPEGVVDAQRAALASVLMDLAETLHPFA